MKKTIILAILLILISACAEKQVVGELLDEKYFLCSETEMISLDKDEFIIGVPSSDNLQIYRYEPVGEFTYKVKNLNQDEIDKLSEGEGLIQYEELKEDFYIVYKDDKLFYPVDNNLSIKELDKITDGPSCKAITLNDLGR